MSQYPVDTEDNVIEAVNYLLATPNSIGQNFEGMSAVGYPLTNIVVPSNSAATVFTGSSAAPFATGATTGIASIPVPGTLPVWSTAWPDISISVVSITPVNRDGSPTAGVTAYLDIIVNVAVTPAPALTANPYAYTDQPFTVGQQVQLSGITPAAYDGTYRIVEYFSNTFMRVQADAGQVWPAYVSGGSVNWNYFNNYTNFGSFLSDMRMTDCNALISVTGATDRVFISNETNLLLTYYGNWDGTPGYYTDNTPRIYYNINRYQAVAKTTLPDYSLGDEYTFLNIYAYGSTYQTLKQIAYQGYLWQLDKIVLSVPQEFPVQATPSYYTLGPTNKTFINIIDNPGIGYYWYTLEFLIDIDPVAAPTLVPMTLVTPDLRSFTAQVIKR